MHSFLLYQNLVIRDDWWYQLYEHFVRPDLGFKHNSWRTDNVKKQKKIVVKTCYSKKLFIGKQAFVAIHFESGLQSQSQIYYVYIVSNGRFFFERKS